MSPQGPTPPIPPCGPQAGVEAENDPFETLRGRGAVHPSRQIGFCFLGCMNVIGLTYAGYILASLTLSGVCTLPEHEDGAGLATDLGACRLELESTLRRNVSFVDPHERAVS